jgi:hypothetical protein
MRKRPARWKTNPKIGFYPDHLRQPVDRRRHSFYQQQGLNVEVTKIRGLAPIRDKMITAKYDATHFVAHALAI